MLHTLIQFGTVVPTVKVAVSVQYVLSVKCVLDGVNKHTPT